MSMLLVDLCSVRGMHSQALLFRKVQSLALLDRQLALTQLGVNTAEGQPET